MLEQLLPIGERCLPMSDLDDLGESVSLSQRIAAYGIHAAEGSCAAARNHPRLQGLRTRFRPGIRSPLPDSGPEASSFLKQKTSHRFGDETCCVRAHST